VRRAATLGRLVIAASILVLVHPCAAQESKAQKAPATKISLAQYSTEMLVDAGYRFVDVDGSQDKYEEDYDIQAGGRLFRFLVNSKSSAPDVTSVDRFRLEVDTPGDEPVSHFRLMAADRERYDFRANFTRSRWRYAVPQLWEEPVPDNVRTDDLHDFDVVRVNGAVDLTIRPASFATVRLGYRLYSRESKNNAISTVRIPRGDIFQVRAPGTTETNVGLLGTTLRVFGTDLLVQQEYRRIDRTQKLMDPLDPAGLDPTDDSTLSVYDSEENDHFDIPITTVRVRRTIGDAVDLTAGYFFSRSNMNFGYDQKRNGTSNTEDFSGTAVASADGAATLTTNIVDAGASWRVHDQVRLHATYRFNDRSQDGDVDELSNFGEFSTGTENDIRMHRATGEVEYEPRPDLVLRGGMRYDNRWAKLSLSGEDSQTTNTFGAIGSIRYRPSSMVNFFLSYENVQVKDPWVLDGAPNNDPPLPDREIALTFLNRGTIGLGLRPLPWMELSYRFNALTGDNDSFDGHARSYGNTVALTLTPIKGLSFLASYTRRDLHRRADILVAPLYDTTQSFQEGSEDVFLTTLRYDFQLFGQKWATGWRVSYINSNSGLQPRLETGGSAPTLYDLNRIDGGAFLTFYHHCLEPTIEFRMIDYNQSPLSRNDYQATIVGLRATKRFNF
jgi:hypothetical protein